MKLFAHQIPVHGRTYLIKSDDNWVREEIEQALDGILLDCSAELTLSNHNTRVQVEGTQMTKIQLNCDVCAADVEVSFEGDLKLSYLPANSPTPDLIPKNKKDLEKINDLISLEEEELDVGWYYDGVLDVGVVLTEYLLISKATIIQCKDENVRRIKAGECRSFPNKGSKNTYNPFAGLDLS